MELTLKKIGNSEGFIIPKKILNQFKSPVFTAMFMNGELIIKEKVVKSKSKIESDEYFTRNRERLLEQLREDALNIDEDYRNSLEFSEDGIREY